MGSMARIEYVKTDGGCPKRVAHECDQSGRERFAERELRSEEWVTFVPSEAERAVARAIQEELKKSNGALRLHHEHGALTIDWAR